ncbi:MAG: hypothetical protein HON32_07100 [Francisellaceae bacterium]|jgi:uncharacterized protein YhdP|nr:hypothetical protein [Francisellaceae bacterium]MBT6539756.1 hypothetical protein [Francisellaceae bacterium]
MRKYILLLIMTFIFGVGGTYKSIGTLATQNDGLVKKELAKTLPENLTYKRLTIKPSFTKGLKASFQEVEYVNGDNTVFFAGIVEAKVAILKSLLQRTVIIDTIMVHDVNLNVSKLGSLQSKSSRPLCDKIYFNNIVLKVGDITTHHLEKAIVKKSAISKGYDVTIEQRQQLLSTTINYKKNNIYSFKVKTKHFDVDDWLNISNDRKLQLTNMSADFDINIDKHEIVKAFAKSDVNIVDLENNQSNGQVEINTDDGDSFKIFISRITLNLPKLYNDKLIIENIRLTTEIVTGGIGIKNLSIQMGGVSYPVMNGELVGSIQDGYIGSLSFDNDKLSFETVKKLVPDKYLPKAKKWLDDSLLDGEITSSIFKFNQNDYKWDANINSIKIDYDDEWPQITNASGKLCLTNDDVEIEFKKGVIYNTKVNNLNARIEFKDDYNLSIQSQLESDLRNTFSFLESSPLDVKLSEVITVATTTGDSIINLKLDIPLEGDSSVVTTGDVIISNASFDIGAEDKFDIEKLNTKISFEQNKVFASDMAFTIDGQEAKGTLFSGKNKKEVSIYIQSILTVNMLNKISPNISQLSVSGKADFNLDIILNADDDENTKKYIFNSNLVGSSFVMDGLYKKNIKESLVTKIVYIATPMQEIFEVNIDSLLNAKLKYTHNKWSGHVDFGENAMADNSDGKHLFISGDLNSYTINNNAKINISNIQPLKLYLKIKKLNISDVAFDDVWVLYSMDEEPRMISLDGSNVSGEIYWDDDDYIKLKLTKLQIGKSKNKEEVRKKFINDKVSHISGIEFSCDNFTYDHVNLGKLRIDAIYKGKGFDVTILLQHKNGAVQMNGHWLNPGMPEQTAEISGNWNIADFGNLVEVLGLNSDFSGGIGYVSTSLNWPDAIFKFDKENVNGDLNLQLENGRITAVDPGFGKILGLLSLDQITRRLKLDFSDVLNKGLAYDKLVMKSKISQGVMHVEDLTINSPSANIFIKGEVHIQKQTLKMVMEISPKVTDTLPVAAAVAAGSPVVGAAIWVVDKVVTSKDKNNKSNQYRYWINGTLSNPKITKAEKMVDH